MKIKNLRINKKYRFVKAAIAGGLVGGVVTCGMFSFIHGAFTGNFQPIITSDTKQEVYGIENRVYSKNGIDVIKTYKRSLGYDEIITFKYNNTEKAYNVGSFDKEKINFICDNIQETDVNKLESLQYYVARYGSEIDADDTDIDVDDFYSNDGYGIEYITRTINSNDQRLEPVFKEKNASWIGCVVPSVMIPLFTGCGVLVGLSSMGDKIDKEEENSNQKVLKRKYL